MVDSELGSKGHASFIVPPGTAGLTQGQKYKKHGIKASHTAEVVLDDVRVPGHCLLGGKEKLDERLARVRRGESGNAQAAMQTFEATRPAVGAQALGWSDTEALDVSARLGGPSIVRADVVASRAEMLAAAATLPFRAARTWAAPPPPRAAQSPPQGTDQFEWACPVS